MRYALLLILITLLGARGAAAAESASLHWDAYIQDLRDGTAPAVVAVSLGSARNRLPRSVADGTIDLHGVPLIVVEARGDYLNPISDGRIQGARLFALWSANAGTLLFLDRDGLLIPQLNLPQVFHANDPEVVGAYAGFAHGEHFREMGLRDYLLALDQQSVMLKIQAKLKRGTGNWRPVLPEADIPVIVSRDGEPVNPREHAGAFFVFGRPDGRAFRAQVREIQEGLASLRATVVAVIPSDLPADAGADLGVTVLRAARGVVDAPCNPRILVLTHEGGGLWMYGYHPRDMIAMQLGGMNIANVAPLQPEIPFTETDVGTLLDVPQNRRPAAP